MSRVTYNKEEKIALAATHDFELELSENQAWNASIDIINQVGAKGFGIYCAILNASRNNGGYFSLTVKQLAEQFGMSKSSVQGIINDLVDCGLLNIVVDCGGNRKAVYKINAPEALRNNTTTITSNKADVIRPITERPKKKTEKKKANKPKTTQSTQSTKTEEVAETKNTNISNTVPFTPMKKIVVVDKELDKLSDEVMKKNEEEQDGTVSKATAAELDDLLDTMM